MVRFLKCFLGSHQNKLQLPARTSPPFPPTIRSQRGRSMLSALGRLEESERSLCGCFRLAHVRRVGAWPAWTEVRWAGPQAAHALRPPCLSSPGRRCRHGARGESLRRPGRESGEAGPGVAPEEAACGGGGRRAVARAKQRPPGGELMVLPHPPEEASAPPPAPGPAHAPPPGGGGGGLLNTWAALS